MKLTNEEKTLAELGDKFFKDIDNCIIALKNTKKYKKEFIKFNLGIWDKDDTKHMKNINNLEKSLSKELKKLNEKRLKSKNDKKIKL